MAVWRNNAEGMTADTAATTGNSGGASGDAFDAVSAGDPFIARAVAMPTGARVWESNPSSGNARTTTVNFPATKDVMISFWIRRLEDVTANHNLVQFRHASGANGALALTTTADGRMTATNPSGSAIFNNFAANLTKDKWYLAAYRLTQDADPDTTNGRAEFAIFDPDDDFAVVYQPTPLTNINAGTNDFTQINLVRPTGTTTDVGPEQWNDIQIWTDTDVPASLLQMWPGEPLETPTVTVTGFTHPSVPDAEDGTITVTWDGITGADSYDAGLVHTPAGDPQQNEVTDVENDVTSPHTFTGLGEGSYAPAIRAVAP